MTQHLFHIPVMGIAYTIDTPIKVAKYGISSAISLVQDDVIEKARKHYSSVYGFDYLPITRDDEDYRSRRITAYLNLVSDIVEIEFEAMKKDPEEIMKYYSLMPTDEGTVEMDDRITAMQPGAIDVNIMTKLDRPGTRGEIGRSEANSAFKGFADSKLRSSMIFSAGLNQSLFTYMQEFPDFFPDEHGELKKKIILKVSDYRSALLQGRILAKKGLWVSEFRIESGLNCGGHAFATQGHLLGPILDEFNKNRKAIHEELMTICTQVWEQSGMNVAGQLSQRITAQGGIGTSDERKFFERQYQVDSTGWGTPFLLVPEATSIDNFTLDELKNAREDDLYSSNASPLGVKFNTIRGNSADREREDRIVAGKPGSPCHTHHLKLQPDDKGRLLCTASHTFQTAKIRELDDSGITGEERSKAFQKITEKECICNGLSVSFLRVFGLESKRDNKGVSICPGPNLAYFDKTYSLREMVDHIYGKINIIDLPRPNVFIKELGLYINHLKEEIEAVEIPITNKAIRYIDGFRQNLLSGIDYYRELADDIMRESEKLKDEFLNELDRFEMQVQGLVLEPAIAE